ncbi:SIMPL domain-containing protein [Loktanella sp. SALINAS62]|uniref:SIMPL domain-containing protein n=1 Tax=Loktanella sp. SALINAS62 TaxID=2706124 RepID=UPI001B8CFBD8|nr:SIMPL domain-containing protein [Loktanella sp. SALINAS62]MBS1303903.1 SIMPL domain-containing protein [Loktanella sp. SALINAS62]
MALGAALAMSLLSTQASAQDARITVQGTGEVAAAPDLARINIGVTHQAETAADAMAAMSADMEQVLSTLSDAGIARTDIQTSGLRLDVIQNYDQASGTSGVTGYRASNDVSVTVNDLDRIGDVLDAVVQSGANQMNGLSFDVGDRETLLNDARRAAVADAMNKAQLYADAAAVPLGSLVSLSETNVSDGPIPMMRMAMDEASAVPVAPGQITISASVTMSWDADD